jgi:hypothetical protein
MTEPVTKNFHSYSFARLAVLISAVWPMTNAVRTVRSDQHQTAWIAGTPPAARLFQIVMTSHCMLPTIAVICHTSGNNNRMACWVVRRHGCDCSTMCKPASFSRS